MTGGVEQPAELHSYESELYDSDSEKVPNGWGKVHVVVLNNLKEEVTDYGNLDEDTVLNSLREEVTEDDNLCTLLIRPEEKTSTKNNIVLGVLGNTYMYCKRQFMIASDGPRYISRSSEQFGIAKEEVLSITRRDDSFFLLIALFVLTLLIVLGVLFTKLLINIFYHG